MSEKINTKYIKENAKCYACESQDLKRIHKKSFNSLIDEDNNFNKSKFCWRQFECKNCQETNNILSSENKLISISKKIKLPFCAFDYYIELGNYLFELEIYYKDSVTDSATGVWGDEILMFKEFFSKHHMIAEFFNENRFEVSFDRNYYNFDNFKDGLKILKDLLNQTGINYDEEISCCDTPIEDCIFEEKDLFF
jgi:hypothetical protein